MRLLRRIEHYLRRSGTAATRFGRAAARDPRFVFDLRNGRTPREQMATRITACLEDAERELPR